MSGRWEGRGGCAIEVWYGGIRRSGGSRWRILDRYIDVRYWARVEAVGDDVPIRTSDKHVEMIVVLQRLH